MDARRIECYSGPSCTLKKIVVFVDVEAVGFQRLLKACPVAVLECFRTFFGVLFEDEFPPAEFLQYRGGAQFEGLAEVTLYSC